MILDEIIEYKKKEVALDKEKVPFAQLVKEIEKKGVIKRDFHKAVKRDEGTPIRLIAEVKKASPSQGVIRDDFEPVEIANIYVQSGANALSVLTDKKFFQGDLSYLSQIREKVNLPLLRKDFTIDEYQIYEAVNAGADAILLIVGALEPAVLQKLYRVATIDLQIPALVEVHTPNEAKTALDIGAGIIGINNRDLKNFEVSLSVTKKIRPLIPKDKVLVSESGIKTREDVKMLADMGVDALLIGETFMRSRDIGVKIRELF
jgi:indole-3-glycerol phosphate synthase